MDAPRVAVIREEGTNGDREMVASLHMAGFSVWDVTMEDIVTRKVTLDGFRGLIFPGGFSYAGNFYTCIIIYSNPMQRLYVNLI